MMEDLCINLMKCWDIAVFFSAWPVIATVVIILKGQSEDGGHVGIWKALHYSLASYAGVSVQESNPTRYKWPKLIHRLIGILAWAFVTALFITTIT